MSSAPMLAINSVVEQILNSKLDFVPARYPEPVAVKPSSYVLIKADDTTTSSSLDNKRPGDDSDNSDEEDVKQDKDHSILDKRSAFYDINENKNDRGSQLNSRIVKSWGPGDKPPIGLQNHSVTCYMNAAMQALFHIPAVSHYLDDVFNGKYKSTISRTSVTEELATLHHRLCTAGKKSSIYPSRMVRRLPDINFLMSPMEQEDSHEYYMSLMGRLQEDSVPKGKKLNSSIFHDIFGGNLNQQVTCKTCGHVSTTSQDFYDIPVSFTKSIKKYGMPVFRLEESITDFFSPELITVDKKQKSGYTCEKCKTLTSAVKINHISQAPEYLTIHMKRFKFEGSVSQKIKEPMLYPQELDLSKYATDKKNSSAIRYKLISIISHSGRTASSGHYVAICRQPDNSWAEYDDEIVSKIRKEGQLQDDNAYILIYTRLTAKATAEVNNVMTTPKKRSHASANASPVANGSSQKHALAALDEIDDIFAKKSKKPKH